VQNSKKAAAKPKQRSAPKPRNNVQNSKGDVVKQRQLNEKQRDTAPSKMRHLSRTGSHRLCPPSSRRECSSAKKRPTAQRNNGSRSNSQTTASTTDTLNPHGGAHSAGP
jgi:hypothetical protein